MIVFIVDDDENLLAVLSRAARNADFTVVTCKNGNELAQALHSHSSEPGLVVLDIHMEDKDGIEAIDDLLQLEQRIRVRFMTGGSDSHVIAASMIAKSRGLNVGHSIFKPFNMNAFVDILRDEEALLSNA